MKAIFRILGTAAAVAATGAAIVIMDKFLNEKAAPFIESIEFPEDAEQDDAEAAKTAEAYAEGEAKAEAEAAAPAEEASSAGAAASASALASPSAYASAVLAASASSCSASSGNSMDSMKGAAFSFRNLSMMTMAAPVAATAAAVPRMRKIAFMS